MIKEGWDALRESKEQDKIHFAKILPKARNEFLILNSAPLYYDGHFHHGKMIHCTGADCQICNQGIGKQGRYAFGVYEYRTGWRCVLELSTKQAETIFNNYLVGDDARFLKITIERISQAKNSNLRITEGRYISVRNVGLYDPVPVVDFLEKYWRGLSDIAKCRAERASAYESEALRKARVEFEELESAREYAERNSPFTTRRL